MTPHCPLKICASRRLILLVILMILVSLMYHSFHNERLLIALMDSTEAANNTYWGKLMKSISQQQQPYTEQLLIAHMDSTETANDTYWGKLMKSISQQQQPYTGPSDILINTYMRSGSTFLGRMVGHGPDTFYWYEPLWKKYTWGYIKGPDQLCQYCVPVCEKISTSNDTISLANSLTFLQDIFNCKLKNHTGEVTPDLVTENGHGWTEYRKCKQTLSGAHCIHHSEKSCKSSVHRAMKVLRLQLRNVQSLLVSNPRLKVLQLFRDPRGVMNSHIRSDWYPIKNASSIDADANVLCSRMRDDLTVGRELMRLLPDRVKIVQYEDFIDFDSKTKILAKFLGLNFSGPYEARVKALNRNKIIGLTQTQKENRLFSYRSSLRWEHLQIINKHCEDIYSQLGLPIFTDIHDYKNGTRPMIAQQLPFSLTN